MIEQKYYPVIEKDYGLMSPDALALELLPVGAPAPGFENVTATGDRVISLTDYAGKFLVMVFYPKDQTPGCTRQLCALRDDIEQFRALNAEVVGVNPGSLQSHERFVAAQSYPFPILVDADKAIARAYGALKPEGGIQRTVYIVSPEGTIAFARQGMPTDDELAQAIRDWQAA